MRAAGLLDHPFGAAYAAKLGPLPGAANARLDGLRGRARADLARDGLPGAKVEDWRFTPLRALSKIPFIPAAAADDVEVTAVPRAVPVIPGAARVVLVNGVFRADLSDANFGGVTVRDMRALLAGDGRGVGGAIASAPLVALNTAFMSDGIAIDVVGAATQTLHIISIGAAGAEPVAFHPRILITAAAGSAVTVVESHVGLPGQPYFSNPVAEISVGPNAAVRRYVQVAEDGDAYHLATASVDVAAGGAYEGFHLGLGGALVRQEIRVTFAAPEASARVHGAYALSGHAHHDFTTVIDHRVPGCSSNQIFKGIADGNSRGVYQGRIQVARDAQKTDARQLHKALFLARGPQFDCKPELEIYADDVQCAHGAATGEIDPNHLFYLMSRGIDAETARGLLVEAFLADVVDEISDVAAREVFAAEIRAWLKRREVRP